MGSAAWPPVSYRPSGVTFTSYPSQTPVARSWVNPMNQVSNDSFDTWFMGFTHDLATGVWLGYDVNVTPLGRYETGGHAALPIWLDYMKAALDGREQAEFVAPEGIVEVKIDPETGKAVPEGARGVKEPFKLGTQPTLPAEGEQKVEVKDLFMQ